MDEEAAVSLVFNQPFDKAFPSEIDSVNLLVMVVQQLFGKFVPFAGDLHRLHLFTRLHNIINKQRSSRQPSHFVSRS